MNYSHRIFLQCFLGLNFSFAFLLNAGGTGDACLWDIPFSVARRIICFTESKENQLAYLEEMGQGVYQSWGMSRFYYYPKQGIERYYNLSSDVFGAQLKLRMVDCGVLSVDEKGVVKEIDGWNYPFSIIKPGDGDVGEQSEFLEKHQQILLTVDCKDVAVYGFSPNFLSFVCVDAITKNVIVYDLSTKEKKRTFNLQKLLPNIDLNARNITISGIATNNTADNFLVVILNGSSLDTYKITTEETVEYLDNYSEDHLAVNHRKCDLHYNPYVCFPFFGKDGMNDYYGIAGDDWHCGFDRFYDVFPFDEKYKDLEGYLRYKKVIKNYLEFNRSTHTVLEKSKEPVEKKQRLE